MKGFIHSKKIVMPDRFSRRCVIIRVNRSKYEASKKMGLMCHTHKYINFLELKIGFANILK